MSLEFDPATNKILYRDHEIGEVSSKDGRSVVHLNIEYETLDENWIVPLSWFAHGLAQLPENRPPEPLVSIETAEDSIEQEFDVPRLLVEKIIKRNGYIWDFHKSDPDPWPSPLHGHDYDRALKLDAITGDIFDVSTRERCKRLKPKHVKAVQDELRATSDLKHLVQELVDKSSD
jgi:hypothetical protein